MRNSSWLILTALAVVAAVAPGCATGTSNQVDPTVSPNDPIGPPDIKKTSPFPGVVEIYRNNDPDHQRVGYCSADGLGHSWWLLKTGETVPVMPDTPMGYVTWRQLSAVYVNGTVLCDTYGDGIAPCQLWYVDGGAPSPCR